MDAVDRQLIQALRENGRASYAELGRLVGLSGPSVTDRINRLEAAGVITGYRATVDSASLGLGVTALIGISLSDAGATDPLFKAVPPVFDAFVGHKEAVSKLPGHATLLAGSPACPVQAFRIGRNVYATQFHPELDVQGLCLRIETYRYAGYFEPDEMDALLDLARSAVVVAWGVTTVPVEVVTGDGVSSAQAASKLPNPIELTPSSRPRRLTRCPSWWSSLMVSSPSSRLPWCGRR